MILTVTMQKEKGINTQAAFRNVDKWVGEYRIHPGIRFQSPTWNLTQHFHLTRVATALGGFAGRVSLLWGYDFYSYGSKSP